jgi:hypothetical protein
MASFNDKIYPQRRSIQETGPLHRARATAATLFRFITFLLDFRNKIIALILNYKYTWTGVPSLDSFEYNELATKKKDTDGKTKQNKCSLATAMHIQEPA